MHIIKRLWFTIMHDVTIFLTNQLKKKVIS